jgi:hypothetical protein
MDSLIFLISKDQKEFSTYNSKVQYSMPLLLAFINCNITLNLADKEINRFSCDIFLLNNLYPSFAKVDSSLKKLRIQTKSNYAVGEAFQMIAEGKGAQRVWSATETKDVDLFLPIEDPGSKKLLPFIEGSDNQGRAAYLFLSFDQPIS